MALQGLRDVTTAARRLEIHDRIGLINAVPIRPRGLSRSAGRLTQRN